MCAVSGRSPSDATIASVDRRSPQHHRGPEKRMSPRLKPIRDHTLPGDYVAKHRTASSTDLCRRADILCAGRQIANATPGTLRPARRERMGRRNAHRGQSAVISTGAMPSPYTSQAGRGHVGVGEFGPTGVSKHRTFRLLYFCANGQDVRAPEQEILCPPPFNHDRHCHQQPGAGGSDAGAASFGNQGYRN